MRPARSRFLIVLIALLAVVGGACVDDGELGGPSIGGSAAVSVGDVALSHGELNDLVDRWAANEAFLAAATQVTEVGTEARRPAVLVNFVLNFWLQSEQGRAAAADDPNLDVSAQAAEAISGLSQQLPAFADFDEDFQMEIAEGLVYQDALATLVGQGVPVEIPPSEVSSRYGTTTDLGAGVVGIEAPLGPTGPLGVPAVGPGEPVAP